ncbi:MAG: glycoside hydrolase family protein [Nitrososphaera sp.]|nr:glycoside hydrolase family protein [Nitrososphaera sp.]
MKSLDRELLVTQLVRHEGLRLKPYKDTVGKLTIGVGRNLTDKGISLREAHVLLENDIDEVVTSLNARLPWIVSLAPSRRDVLYNMAFNLGVAGLLKFKVTLANVKNGEYKLAAVNMLKSKWASQVGRRAEELAQQMRTGVYA